MNERLGGALSQSALQIVAREVATAEHQTLPNEAAQLVAHAGVSMRRLFCVWNRGYKTQCVLAVDIHEALELSSKSRHVSRPNMYRRFADVTDETLAEDPSLQRAIDADISGVAAKVEGDGWKIGDTIVS